MKYLLLPILIVCLISSVYSEVRVKSGYAHSSCKYVEPGYDIAVSFEKRYNKRLAGELEFGLERHKIKEVGYLNSFKISLFGKVYITNTIWLGVGGELMNNFIDETNIYYKRRIKFHEYTAYVNNEWRYGVSVGKNWDSWFLEARGMLGDLDLESNLPYEIGLEESSHLNCIIVRIGRKW